MILSHACPAALVRRSTEPPAYRGFLADSEASLSLDDGISHLGDGNIAPGIAHNGTVTTSATYSQAVRAVKRPDPVAVGTIVWLGSEVMFFAGLFAIYFTLRSTSASLWAEETQLLNVPFATVNTIILVLSSVTCRWACSPRSGISRTAPARAPAS